MIYLTTTNNHMVEYIHYMPFDATHGLGKSEEELLQTGFLVESIPPEPTEIPEGKMARLYYENGQFTYKLEEIPEYIDPMTELKQQIIDEYTLELIETGVI